MGGCIIRHFPPQVRSVAGHPSLGKRGYTTAPMERRHRELLVVAEWQQTCPDPDSVAAANK
jgi:hypothetical protein